MPRVRLLTNFLLHVAHAADTAAVDCSRLSRRSDAMQLSANSDFLSGEKGPISLSALIMIHLNPGSEKDNFLVSSFI